jgi:hypothetical protein
MAGCGWTTSNCIWSAGGAMPAPRSPWSSARDLPRLLAEHRANSRRAWGLLALLTAITLLATLALARVLGRQHHLFQALSVADAKNQSLIEQLEQEKSVRWSWRAATT